MDSILLECCDLSFNREDHKIIKDHSIKINSGELIVVTGSNGSGKTTLLNLYAGILKPKKGHINRKQVSYMGHENGLRKEQTCNENLKIWNCIYSDMKDSNKDEYGDFEVQAAFNELIDWFNVGYLNKKVADLSFGEKRKIALIRTFASPAQLLILDEPSKGLDLDTKTKLAALIKKRLPLGHSFVIATHDIIKDSEDVKSSDFFQDYINKQVSL